MADGREIDIDWFTDLTATAGHPQLDVPIGMPREMRVLGAYFFGKTTWYASHLGSKGYFAPFRDPGERTAVLMVISGAKYSDVFTDALMSQECP